MKIPLCQFVSLSFSVLCINGVAQSPSQAKPPATNTEEVFIEQFKVPQGFFKASDPNNKATKEDAEMRKAREAGAIICNGPVFPHGCAAIYNSRTQTLIVKGPRSYIEECRKIIADFMKKTKQAKQAKK